MFNLLKFWGNTLLYGSLYLYILVVYWLCTGCVLVVYWLSIGCVLVVYWLSIGCVLVVYWLSIGCVLVVYWLCIGSVEIEYFCMSEYLFLCWIALKVTSFS